MTDGQWVTPREFDAVNARIDSIEEKVDDVGKDVKVLLAARNRAAGAAEERSLVLTAQRDTGARRIAWSAAVSSLIGAGWWIQDAFARLHH